MKGLFNAVKIALILAVLSLAIVGTLSVFDVFTAEATRVILIKLMKLIGIWTGASLIVFIIVLLGNKNN
jgi:hypothetical protein